MKELLISIVILIVGVICVFSEWDFNLLLWGFIPLTAKVIGILAIVVGALGVLVGIASIKKGK